MSSPLNNLTDTWNNGATVFYGLKYNITNTASAAGSLLMDLQVGSSSLFNIDKSGNVMATSFAGFTPLNPAITFGTALINFDPAGIGNGAYYIMTSTTFTINYSSLPINWAGQTFLWGNVEGNNSLSLRNGANANRFLVYNTYTDASNYERGVFDWTTTSNVLTIGTQAQGTGTARNINFITGGSFIDFTINGTFIVRVEDNGFLKTKYGLGLSGSGSPASPDASISRSASGVVQFGDGGLNANATIVAKTKAGAFAAGDIPSGTWALCRDTSGATTKLIYNNAGTLMTVALT